MKPRSNREPERLVDEAGAAGRHVATARAAFDAAAEGPTHDRAEARSWLAVEGRLARPRRWWPRLLVSAGVAVAALGAWMLRPAPRPEAPPAATAPVVVAPPPAPPVPLPDTSAAPAPARSRPLVAGRSISTGGVRARLSARGAGAMLAAGEARPSFALERGALEVDAADAPPTGGPVSVRVAALKLEGQGARFSVRAGTAGKVTVAVGRGEVAVWSGQRLLARVVAGQRWETPPAESDRAPPAGPRPPAAGEDCLTLAGRGLTDAAVTCLEAQSASPGLAGETAFLELARIRRDAIGDLPGAARVLADYRRRYPQGVLAAEAGLARAELLLRLDRAGEALAEAERLSDPEAGFWRAAALARLGRAGEARQAFDDYLAEPGGRRRAEASRRRGELGP